MNRETVHLVKEKSMYRNALQLNTDIKERTNEEGLMNHRKGGGGGGGGGGRRKKKKRKKTPKNKRERERERWGNIKACMQLRFKKTKKQKNCNQEGYSSVIRRRNSPTVNCHPNHFLPP